MAKLLTSIAAMHARDVTSPLGLRLSHDADEHAIRCGFVHLWIHIFRTEPGKRCEFCPGDSYRLRSRHIDTPANNEVQ
jgi:hypothetical protein